MKGNGVGLWLLWRPFGLHHPSTQATWRKEAPIALNMRCFPAKAHLVIHDEPHPNHHNNKGWICFFVTFNSVCLTELVLLDSFIRSVCHFTPRFVYLFHIYLHATLSPLCFIGTRCWNASRLVSVRAHQWTCFCEDWAQSVHGKKNEAVHFKLVLFLHYIFYLYLFAVNQCSPIITEGL